MTMSGTQKWRISSGSHQLTNVEPHDKAWLKQRCIEQSREAQDRVPLCPRSSEIDFSQRMGGPSGDTCMQGKVEHRWL